MRKKNKALVKVKTKIITIEGYVYAPNFEKGDFVRELKSMIYSLKWSHSQ